ncbi:hypothetical protein F4703DRAFT_1915127 [Phycomyces blakesleeanus]
MLVNSLPFEILSNIADFLQTPDILTGSVVCRAWKRPFEESLWRHITITSDHQLDIFCDKLYNQQLSGNKFDHHVRQLDLSYHRPNYPESFNLIEQSFPLLDHLCISDNAWFTTDPPPYVNWSHWKTLTRLDWWIFDSAVLAPESYFALSFLPNLTSLKLSYDCEDEGAFTLDGFEMLLQNTPRLKTLSVDSLIGNMPETDLARIKTLPPSTTLTALFIESYSWDLGWLCYWAHKCPNIQSLEWNSSVTGTTPHHMDEASEVLKTMQNAFKNLKRFDMEALKDSHADHFFELLHQCDTSLKHLELRLKSDEQYVPLKMFEEAPFCFFESLETIFLDLAGETSDLFLLPYAFRTCCRLANLKIIAPDLIIELDVLLDHCQALKTLELNVCEVATSDDTPLYPSAHALRVIELEKATLPSSLFYYISQRCPQLSRLHILDSDVVCSLSCTAGNMSIFMPYTHLDTLMVTSVEFHVITNSNNMESVVLNYLHLVQIDSPSEQTTFSFRPIRPTSHHSTDLEIHPPQWYCQYAKDGTPDTVSFQALDIDQTRQFELYLKSKQCTEDLVERRIKEQNCPGHPLDANDWMEDLLPENVALQIGGVRFSYRQSDCGRVFRTSTYATFQTYLRPSSRATVKVLVQRYSIWPETYLVPINIVPMPKFLTNAWMLIFYFLKICHSQSFSELNHRYIHQSSIQSW